MDEHEIKTKFCAIFSEKSIFQIVRISPFSSIQKIFQKFRVCQIQIQSLRFLTQNYNLPIGAPISFTIDLCSC
jgi:hypothetical protein